jgi:opacity protein-like surface antigen
MNCASVAKLLLLAAGTACLLRGSPAAAQTTAPAPGPSEAPAPTYSPPPPRYSPAPAPPPPNVYVLEPVPLAPMRPVDPNSSFTFSVGYARLESSGGNSKLDGTDGWYLDSDFEFRLKPGGPLWAGFSLSGSYFEESSNKRIDTTVLPTEAEVDAAVSNFSIEPRLTLVLLPKQSRGPYLAGRIGAGLLIADYWATSFVERPGGVFIDSEGDTTFAFEVRPGAQFGYCGGPWVVGAEVSEMWAWGDFNRLGDQLNELRVGFFFTMRY